MIVNLTPNGCLSFRHWLGEFEFLEFVWSEWKIPCDFIINILLLKKKKKKPKLHQNASQIKECCTSGGKNLKA